MSKAKKTRETAENIMAYILSVSGDGGPSLPVLKSLKRRISSLISSEEAKDLESKNPSIVAVSEFNETLAMMIPGYDFPHFMTPAQIAIATRVLVAYKMTRGRVVMFAEWLAGEEWFMKDPSYSRALNAIGHNIRAAEKARMRREAAALAAEERELSLQDEEVSSIVSSQFPGEPWEQP